MRNTDGKTSLIGCVQGQDHLKTIFFKESVPDEDLKRLGSILTGGTVLHEVLSVPWFPQCIEDLNWIGDRMLVFGDGIEEVDHPGCSDPSYRDRR